MSKAEKVIKLRSNGKPLKPLGSQYLVDNMLQAWVRSIEYDFSTHSGKVFLEDDGCADMSGCIKMFQAIDDAVCCVQTTNDEGLDTRYEYQHGSDEWIAISPALG
jgi:hypothetical protein